MASPAATVRALARLAWGSTLWIQLLITLKRLVIGLAIGAAVGWMLGVAAGLEPAAALVPRAAALGGHDHPRRHHRRAGHALVRPGRLHGDLRGGADRAADHVREHGGGVLAIDPRLVEMGRVYRFPRGLLLSEIYLPGIASPAMAGLTLATGIAVRAVVLAEVLAATSGIGHAFARAKQSPRDPGVLRLDPGAARADGCHRVRRAAAGQEAGHALEEGRPQ